MADEKDNPPEKDDPQEHLAHPKQVEAEKAEAEKAKEEGEVKSREAQTQA
jgi:hypothetical protein